MNRPGIRFTITRHNELADIPALVSALAESFALATSAVDRRGDEAHFGEGESLEAME